MAAVRVERIREGKGGRRGGGGEGRGGEDFEVYFPTALMPGRVQADLRYVSVSRSLLPL